MRAVFGFGRVNPPTLGHAQVVEAISKMAGQADASPRLFLSRSHDPKRNPLAPDEKLAFVRRAFPTVQVELKQTLFDATRSMAEESIDEAILVIGEDRVEEFTRRFLPYQGTEALGLKTLSISPITRPAGAVSATSVRQLAVAGDWDGFKRLVPGDEILAADLFRTVRRRMGVLDGNIDEPWSWFAGKWAPRLPAQHVIQ